jgi:hypothetical protein
MTDADAEQGKKAKKALTLAGPTPSAFEIITTPGVVDALWDIIDDEVAAKQNNEVKDD